MQLVDERSAAAETGHSPRTYQKWRQAPPAGGGPPFHKLGRSVKYDLRELRAWVDAQRRTSTRDTTAA